MNWFAGVSGKRGRHANPRLRLSAYSGISAGVKIRYFLSCPSQRLFFTSQSGSGPKSDEPVLCNFRQCSISAIVGCRCGVGKSRKIGHYADNGPQKISQDRYRIGVIEIVLMFRGSTQRYVNGIRKGEKER